MSMNQFTLSLCFSHPKCFIVSPINHFGLWSSFHSFSVAMHKYTACVLWSCVLFRQIHKSRELVFKFCFTMITSLKLNVVNSSSGTITGCRVRGFFVRGDFGKGFVFREGGRSVTDSFLINKTSIRYSNRSSTTYIYNAPSFVIYSLKNIDFHS